MILGMTYYQICWYFLIYSCIGWCLEVTFHAVSMGLVINRGFLNGPVCPVYGFGMLLLLGVLDWFQGAAGGAVPESCEVLVLYVFGVFFATAVELTAGWLLDRIFHARWWDYSDFPYNFHGYICLKFSLLWGAGAIIVITAVHPVVQTVSAGRIPENWGWPILGICYVMYASDLIVTVAEINGMNRKLAELDRVKRSMRMVSDELTGVIAGGAIRTHTTLDEGRVQAALARAELRDAAGETREKLSSASTATLQAAAGAKAALAEKASAGRKLAGESMDPARWKEKYAALEKKAAGIRDEILRPRFFGTRRLLRAFPDMKHRDYDESIKELRQFLDRFEEEERRRTGGPDKKD